MKKTVMEGTTNIKIKAVLIFFFGLLCGCQSVKNASKPDNSEFVILNNGLKVNNVQIEMDEFGHPYIFKIPNGVDDGYARVVLRENGSIESITYIHNKVNHGRYLEFHGNGKIFLEYEYKLGCLNSIKGVYSDKGDLYDWGTFSNGNGEVKEFTKSGALEAYGGFENGLKEGRWVYVTNTGHRDTVYFKKGILIDPLEGR